MLAIIVCLLAAVFGCWSGGANWIKDSENDTFKARGGGSGGMSVATG